MNSFETKTHKSLTMLQCLKRRKLTKQLKVLLVVQRFLRQKDYVSTMQHQTKKSGSETNLKLKLIDSLKIKTKLKNGVLVHNTSYPEAENSDLVAFVAEMRLVDYSSYAAAVAAVRAALTECYQIHKVKTVAMRLGLGSYDTEDLEEQMHLRLSYSIWISLKSV